MSDILKIFLCINCKSIKQTSYILECFHVICGDCIATFEQGPEECCTIPTNSEALIPHPLTEQYAQQLQHLYKSQLLNDEKSKCVICQCEEQEDRSILFCVNCASFWCGQHQELHNRAMFNGHQHPFIKLTNDMQLQDVLTEVKQETMNQKEKEVYGQLNRFIENCESLLAKGRDHQQKLDELSTTIDKWKEKVSEDIDTRFSRIREMLEELELEAKKNVETTCQQTKEQLETCHMNNEMKLSKVMRAVEIMMNIKSFCPQKGGGILKALTFEKFEEQSMTSFVTFLLEMTPRIIKISRELAKEGNKISIEARIIDPKHTEIVSIPDKQLYEGSELQIRIHTFDQHDVEAFSTNSIISIEVYRQIPREESVIIVNETFGKERFDKNKSSYIHRLEVLEAGEYQIKLTVNNIKVNKNWNFSVSRDISSIKNPTVNYLEGKGERSGIAIQGNYLYVVSGARGEVEMYSIDRGFYSEEKTELRASTLLVESGRRFYTPRFELPGSFMRSSSSTPDLPSFPNAKFGINLEMCIGNGVLAGPHGICCFEDFIYVSDRVANAVFCFTNIGAFLQKLGKQGSDIGEFSSPHGMAINKTSKQLVVTDRFNHRIQLVNLTTGSMMAVGYSEQYILQQPVDVAITNEEYYIVSTANNDIVFYDNAFQWIKRLLKEIQDPMYITIDQTNQLYISSYTEHKVYTILPLPNNIFNIREVEIGEAKNPAGLAAGSDCSIYAVCHNKENPVKPLLYSW